MSSVAAWVLASVVAAGVGGVLAEFLARWWLRHRQVYYVWAPRHRKIVRPDREAFPAAEAVAHFEVNSVGQRGDEPPGPDEAAYRILVAGGSTAECMFLDQWTSWPGALERLLDRPEPRKHLGVSRVHVGNIGRSDIDSQGLDVALRRILPGCPRLDAIIILVGASNVLRWLAAGAPEGMPAPPLPELEIFDWQPNGPFSFHPKRTASAELARRLRLRLRPTEQRPRAGKYMIGARAMRQQAMPLRNTVPDPLPMLDAYEAALRSALRTAMRHADRVIVARQPWLDKPRYTAEEQAQFWHGALGNLFAGGEIKEFASSELIAQLMSQIDRRAVTVAEELGLEHINLREALEPSLCNYYDQFHFTPTGAAKVAEAVAAVVLRGASQPRSEASSAFEYASHDVRSG
ncbi:MAG: hypothetical protein ABR499_23335 [Gemmatimonadaceae bacterium]